MSLKLHASPHDPPAPLRVQRPWGGFDQFCLNEPVTVKIITVNAGASLSLQRHQHRGELWVALDPGLRVEADGKEWTLNVGEEVWLPAGTVHRLSAPAAGGRIMEVAFGEFDEDDIERFSDRYGRLQSPSSSAPATAARANRPSISSR